MTIGIIVPVRHDGKYRTMTRLHPSSLFIFAILCGCLSTVWAQQEEETLVQGVPFENRIVGRDVAVRLRTEIRITEENDDLIDVSYERFPTEIYAAEIKLFHKNRLTLGTTYEMWENSQDLDCVRLGLAAGIPVGPLWKLAVRYGHKAQEDDLNSDYLQVGATRSLGRSLYSYCEYRYLWEADYEQHQLSEYISWNVSPILRMGGQIALSSATDADGVDPWYVRGFATVFLIKTVTSLRVEAKHYKSRGDLTFQEYQSYLYQKLSSKAFVRLGCRYYTDSDDLDSIALGIKAKYYVNARLSAHIGYRAYDHSEGADFDTGFAGVGVLL